MYTITQPILSISPEGIGTIIGTILILLATMFLFGLSTRKYKGRTIREFQSSADVWEVMERWAVIRKYKLIEQANDSRTYQMRERVFPILGFIPKVKVTKTDNRYRLEVWMTVRALLRIFPAMFYPREIRVDVESLWIGGDWRRSNPRPSVSMDVNTLIDIIDVGIEPIP